MVQTLTETETRNESIKLEQRRFMEKRRKSHEDKLMITPAVKVQTDDHNGDDSNLFLMKINKHLQDIYLLNRSLLKMVVT